MKTIAWTPATVLAALDAGIPEVAREYNLTYATMTAGRISLAGGHVHLATQHAIAKRLNLVERALLITATVVIPVEPVSDELVFAVVDAVLAA